MRRLALLMIFSIVATMTFGCGKTEGEEKSTKEEVTTILETEEPLETKDDKVDLLEYIDELKRVAYYFNMKESDSEKGNVEQHWKGNGIEINVIKGSSQKLHDYNYPDFQIIVTDNDEISVLGYSLGNIYQVIRFYQINASLLLRFKCRPSNCRWFNFNS